MDFGHFLNPRRGRTVLEGTKKDLHNATKTNIHGDILCFMVMRPSLLQRLALRGWRLVVGGGWRLAGGGWWRLAVSGWRLAVGGLWELSLRAVLGKKKNLDS